MADVSTKVFGTNNVSKTRDSFNINSSAIPHTSTNVTATNVRDAIEEVATAIAIQASAPTSDVTEGDIWYDTDDNILYVRVDSAWKNVVVADLLDQDDFSSNSATAVATQQSIKAYVDTQITGGDLDLQGDSGGALSVDLDSETLTLAGGTGIDTVGSSETVTFNLDLNELATETVIADGDFIPMVDISESNASNKITFENLEDAIFSSVSGDIVIAEDGAATIQANSVALTTDTTGNYMVDVSAGTLIDVSHSAGEGSTATVNVDLTGAGEAAIANGDYILFLDGGATGTHAKEAIADVATLFAGTGMTATNSVLNVIGGTGITANANEITTTDSEIVHDNLSGFVANEHIDHSGVTLTAGVGLSGGGTIASNRTFTVDLNELTTETSIAQLDFVAMVDAGDAGSGKITFSDLEDQIFGNVSGDATIAAEGALTIASTSVEGSMLNTNVISGQTEMTGDVADADELMVSDDGTVKRADFSVVRDAVFGDVSGDIAIAAGGAATIQANSVALGNDTTGNYVATIAGTSNEVTVSGSGSETAGVTIGLPDDVTIAGDMTITGDLKVNGDTVTQNVSTMTVNDPIISLQTADNGANLGSDTNKDVGLAMFYHTGAAAKTAFLGWDDSAGKLTFVPDASISSEVVSGSVGTIVANLEGNVTGDLTGTASLATTVTITDNDNTNENNAVVFTSGGDTDGGNIGLESDSDLTYNPSTGRLTATQLSGTLQTASQGNVTSLGTLTALTVDNLGVDGNTITANTGALNLTPASGSAIVLDGTINVDAGVVTGATSITSTAFVGDITGDVTGTADLATSFTASANNSADETVYPVFVDDPTGTQGAETDTGLTYNPSTGLLTATAFSGNITGTLQTASQGNITSLGTLSTLTVDSIIIDGTNIGHTSDTDSMAIAANGVVTFSQIPVLPANTIDSDHYVDDSIDTAHIADDQVTLAKMAGLVRGKIIYGDSSGNPAALTVGSANYVLTSDGTDVSWASTGSMSSFHLEDDDGTEVTINDTKEVKFIGSGITTNWTNTSNGTDADPYDLTFTVNAAQTGITSLLATDIKIGEDDQTKIDFETADEIHFYANNTEQVYLADNIFGPQSDSDVDLGTTGVRWKDAFVDSITVTGAITGGTFNFDATDYISHSDNAYLSFVVNNNEELRLEADGDLHADGDVIAYSTTISDKRLKENIVVVENALEKVNQIRGVTFNRKEDGVESAGVIAQEVEKILPQAVREKALPLQTGDEETKYKLVEYDALTSILIESIKELSSRVEELEAKSCH